jgi:hypothetical protein
VGWVGGGGLEKKTVSRKRRGRTQDVQEGGYRRYQKISAYPNNVLLTAVFEMRESGLSKK